MPSTTTLLINVLLKHTVLNTYCRLYCINYSTWITVLICAIESNVRNFVDLLVVSRYTWADKINRSGRDLFSVL